MELGAEAPGMPGPGPVLLFFAVPESASVCPGVESGRSGHAGTNPGAWIDCLEVGDARVHVTGMGAQCRTGRQGGDVREPTPGVRHVGICRGLDPTLSNGDIVLDADPGWTRICCSRSSVDACTALPGVEGGDNRRGKDPAAIGNGMRCRRDGVPPHFGPWPAIEIPGATIRVISDAAGIPYRWISMP